MIVIVSVKINEGIVLASDSASTFTNTQVYDHAEKIVNLVKGLPIGVMSTGDGGIGSESLTTLLKDLGKRLADKQDSMYLDPSSYVMADVAGRLHHSERNQYHLAERQSSCFVFAAIRRGDLCPRFGKYSFRAPSPTNCYWFILKPSSA
jgi:ATP-dependent protease HslVU (ClpYQ) peptidase subunit